MAARTASAGWIARGDRGLTLTSLGSGVGFQGVAQGLHLGAEPSPVPAPQRVERLPVVWQCGAASPRASGGATGRVSAAAAAETGAADFFQQNLLRIVDDVVSVIKGSIELWPTLVMRSPRARRRAWHQWCVDEPRLHGACRMCSIQHCNLQRVVQCYEQQHCAAARCNSFMMQHRRHLPTVIALPTVSGRRFRGTHCPSVGSQIRIYARTTCSGLRAPVPRSCTTCAA